MRHIFLAVVTAVAIMGCDKGEGGGDCEEQEVEIDCLEAAAAIYSGRLDEWWETGGQTAKPTCIALTELQSQEGCADVVRIPACCDFLL